MGNSDAVGEVVIADGRFLRERLDSAGDVTFPFAAKNTRREQDGAVVVCAMTRRWR